MSSSSKSSLMRVVSQIGQGTTAEGNWASLSLQLQGSTSSPMTFCIRRCPCQTPIVPSQRSILTMGAAALLALTFVASAWSAEPVLNIKPAQVEALGIQTKAAIADSTGSTRGLPSTVLVPSSQQRVVAAPLPGLVESLRASVGDTVRAGQALAVLRSSQAQELQRDALTTSGQSSLAESVLARDELLHKEGLIALSRLEATRAHAKQARLLQQDRQRALAQAGA
ncbi:MAG: biotin/lipoyl-binding protein, partial [Burkholderiaceae bacterium]